MTTIKEQIDAEIKQSMIDKDNVKKELLKVVKSEISRAENGEKGLHPFDDKGVIKQIQKIVKSLETIGSDQAKYEIEILSKYIPTQMSEEQVRETVTILVAETGANSQKDIGKIMGAFKVKYDGQADNAVVSKIARELLTA